MSPRFRWPSISKDQVEKVRGLAEIAALIVAAIWFVTRGEATNRLNLVAHVQSLKVSEGLAWLSCDLEVENVGSKRVSIANETVRLQQVLPLTPAIQERLKQNARLFKNEGDSIVGWPLLEKKEMKEPLVIGPGEKQHLSCDFQIPSGINVVRVYFLLARSADASFVWDYSLIHAVNWKDSVHEQ
jgi:hypothetical protein